MRHTCIAIMQEINNFDPQSLRPKKGSSEKVSVLARLSQNELTMNIAKSNNV